MQSTIEHAVPVIPENAPFNSKQRAWLNGFFAGLVSTGQVGQGTGNGSAVADPAVPDRLATSSSDQAAEATGEPDQNGSAPSAVSWQDVVDDDPNQYPWHDSEKSLDDRMEMAEGQPLEYRMMAAMAQLDCGQCGYLCRTYSKALQTGEETDLKKCSPGGKQTARILVKLRREVSEGDSDSGASRPTASHGSAVERSMSPEAITSSADVAASDSNNAVPQGGAVQPGANQLAYSRQNPFPAPAIHVERLSGDESAKDTRLISLSLSGSGLQYKVGDAIGVFPKNPKEQVEALIRLLQADGGEPIRTPEGVSTTLRGALEKHCDIKQPSDELLESLLERASDREDKKNVQRCLDEQQVPGLVDEPRVIDVIARFRSIRLTAGELIGQLDALKPRLYSIASSPVVDPNRVDLIVGVVQYELSGQRRHGVASTFLANRMTGHEPVPIFVQPCHHFELPEDPQTPMIMVGPGTGIAPFRAFLHERQVRQASGDNWLFFGDQHAASDFLLREELGEMQQSGLLTQLSTAFSRDQDQRVYVQHRMLEQPDELWSWLQRGAHFYVCGDASRMAGDVDRALHEVAMTSGGLSKEAAVNYIKSLKQSNRYQRDVY